MNCSLGLYPEFQPILFQLDVAAKRDVKYLERPVRPCKEPRKRERDSLLCTQPQDQRLVAVDLGFCYRLIPAGILAGFVNIGLAFHEGCHVVDIGRIPGRSVRTKENNSVYDRIRLSLAKEELHHRNAQHWRKWTTLSN